MVKSCRPQTRLAIVIGDSTIPIATDDASIPEVSRALAGLSLPHWISVFACCKHSGENLCAEHLSDEPRPLASIFKLIIAIFIEDCIRNKSLCWHDQLGPLTEETNELAITHLLSEETYTVRNCLAFALTVSDNRCANMLMDVLRRTGDFEREAASRFGVRFNGFSDYSDNAIPHGVARLSGTARQCVGVLQTIFGDPNYDVTRQAMRSCMSRDRLRRRLDDSLPAFNKTGTLTKLGVFGDVGVLQGRNDWIHVACLCEGAPSEGEASELMGEIGARLSAAVNWS